MVFLVNQEVLRENARNTYRNLSKEKNELNRAYRRDTETWQKTKGKGRNISKKLSSENSNKYKFCLHGIKMRGKTRNFDEVKINKNRFHNFKQPIDIKS